MRRRYMQATAALVFVAVLMTGCPTMPDKSGGISEEESLALAVQAYNDTLETVINLRKDGVIDDETYLEINRYRATASRALDAWRESLEEGGDIDNHIDRFYRALQKLREVMRDERTSN